MSGTNGAAPDLPADELLLRARLENDTGRRVPLDHVIAAFGFDRAELEAELAADELAGRD